MFTLLVTPRHKNIKNWALPDPPGAHNLHAGVFRHGEKDFDSPGTQKATKKLKSLFQNPFFSYFLGVGGGGWNKRDLAKWW